jgi:hypothetical protein
MRKLFFALGIVVALGGCARKDALDIPTGSDVTVEKSDGVAVTGRLVEVKPDQIVIESAGGVRTKVVRTEIARVRSMHAADPGYVPVAAAAPAAPVSTGGDDARTPAVSDAKTPDAESQAVARNQAAKAAKTSRTAEYREVTVPAGTTLTVVLGTRVASNTSHVEDAVRGTLRSPLHVDGLVAVPAGTALLGHVTSAKPAEKVKGLASIGLRFNTIDLPGDGGREPLSTATYVRTARATKQKDAVKIGAGAGAGAIIGGILGGGGGAAKGAAIGGGAGSAVVLSTKGDEVGIPAGTPLSIRLTGPLTVRVAMR